MMLYNFIVNNMEISIYIYSPKTLDSYLHLPSFNIKCDFLIIKWFRANKTYLDTSERENIRFIFIQFLKQFIFFSCVYMCVYRYVYAPHVYTVPSEARREQQIPWNWSNNKCYELSHGYWELNMCSLALNHWPIFPAPLISV